jgi:hypothetical protein
VKTILIRRHPEKVGYMQVVAMLDGQLALEIAARYRHGYSLQVNAAVTARRVIKRLGWTGTFYQYHIGKELELIIGGE